MLSIEGIRQTAGRAFFLGLLIFPFLTSGQDEPVKPDYKAIEAAVTDSTSGYYYPTLMARLIAGDSTINLEESRHLYYGFQFQPSYSPYRTSPSEREMNQLINKPDQHTHEELHQLVVLADSVLANYPFDLRTISIKIYCHDMLNMPEETAKLKIRGRVLLDAIFSSGDGKSEKTRFFVLHTGNEYSIINVLGFEFGGQQSLTKGKCDVLTLKPNPMGFTELYFDVTALFNATIKMLEK